MALEILAGNRSMENVPGVLEVPQLNAFDWRQIKHWHLSTSALPAGSLIVNREFSLWDFKYHAIAVLAFVILQTLLIFWLLAQKRHRKLAEEELRRRLKFETLLSEISTGFIHLAAEQIDDPIMKTQRRVCELLGLDFSALWQLSLEDPRFFYQTHVYRPLGGPPLPEQMEAEAHFSWVLQQLRSGNIVAISTEEAPTEAARDQEAWRHYGVKSSLTFPLSAGGSDLLIGALSFGTMGKERLWPEPLVKQLELFAQVFANAIARKRTDHELRESESRLKLATDAARAGLWIMDADTGEVWVSEKTRDLLHFLPDERVTSERFFTVIHPDDHQPVRQAVNRALRSGEDLVVEYRILHPDGSIRWIGARGQRYGTAEPFRLMGASVDITERKDLEESVRKAAQEWQATFDSTPDIIMILDEDLKIRRHNAAATSFFDLSSPEILGRHCHDLMHETKEPSLDCPVRRSFQSRDHQEEEIYDPKRQAWYQTSSDPILDQEGNVTRIVHRIKDITKRVKAEAGARKQWEHLAHVTRMGIMGELTASLAHEINQPLTAIQSNAEAAMRFMGAGEPDTNEVRQILEDISRDNARAGSIILKIRALLKKEPIPFTVLDVNELIADVLSLLRADSLLRELVIIRDFFPELPPVFGDRVQLQQVIINLILNGTAAMKHVPAAQRRLVIRTETTKESAVKVSVTDFGTGIAEQHTETLFEPFYTSKPDGMGMGLTISQTIINEHGGTIEASNHPEGGATFALTLPIHQGDQP